METPAEAVPDQSRGGSESLQHSGMVPSAVPAIEAATYQPAIAILRVAAVLGVVVLHVSSPVLRGTDPGATAWWIADFYNAATRWCVPVFVMISGALLLDPRRQSPAGVFYRKRMSRVLIPLVFWTAFYLGWQACFAEVTLRSVVAGVVRGNPFIHLWYLYMIAGLYFITPALQAMLRATSRREQIGMVVPLLIAVSAHDLINTLTAAQGRATLFSLFVPYIPYYLCGLLLKQWVIPPRWVKFVAAGVIAAWLGIALGTGLLFSRGGSTLLSPVGPVVILMSIGVFLLVSSLFRPGGIHGGPAWRVLQFLDERSFGIYLVHMVFRLILEQRQMYTRYIIPHPLFSIPLVSALVILASLLVTSLLKAVPGLRRVV